MPWSESVRRSATWRPAAFRRCKNLASSVTRSSQPFRACSILSRTRAVSWVTWTPGQADWTPRLGLIRPTRSSRLCDQPVQPNAGQRGRRRVGHPTSLGPGPGRLHPGRHPERPGRVRAAGRGTPFNLLAALGIPPDIANTLATTIANIVAAVQGAFATLQTAIQSAQQGLSAGPGVAFPSTS